MCDFELSNPHLEAYKLKPLLPSLCVFSKKENFVRLSYGGTIKDGEKGLDIIL